MFERILVAVDGSPHADRALESATELAKRFKSKLTLITVVQLRAGFGEAVAPVPPVTQDEIRNFHHMVDERANRIRAQGVAQVEAVVTEGYVVDAILTYVEQHPQDLLVVGARGLSATGRLFLGSTSDGLVHHARCPVLVFRTEPKSGR